MAAPNPMDARTATKLSIPWAVVIFWMPKSTLQLDTTTSFAAMPEISATTICQYPRPSGSKNGTISFPTMEPKLSLISVTYPVVPKFRSAHMIMDARKITVPAFVR